jgi:fructokinase
MSRFDCTVIGDVFIDLPAKFDSEYLDFSSGGTSYCEIAKPVFGGSGNLAVGISKLGGQAAFIGKAGNDAFGKAYEKDLKKNGVFSKMFFDECLPTGLIIALVQKRERSFLVSRGANDQLMLDEIRKAENLLGESTCIYFCGYSLVHDPQRYSILQAIELSRKHGARIIFDPGAYNLVRSERAFFRSLLDLCDVISLNVDEAKAITNANSFKSMVKEIGQKVPLTVLKCGEKGSLLHENGKFVKTEGYNIEPVDTTGAGDAFTSALIYGLTHQLSLESTCKLGNWFAAQVTGKIGARSFPSKSEINHFLQNQILRIA